MATLRRISTAPTSAPASTSTAGSRRTRMSPVTKQATTTA